MYLLYEDNRSYNWWHGGRWDDEIIRCSINLAIGAIRFEVSSCVKVLIFTQNETVSLPCKYDFES